MKTLNDLLELFKIHQLGILNGNQSACLTPKEVDEAIGILLRECMKEDAGYLGWANSWSEEPLIINKCKEFGHKTIEYKIGNCQYLVYCENCGYIYKYDSS